MPHQGSGREPRSPVFSKCEDLPISVEPVAFGGHWASSVDELVSAEPAEYSGPPHRLTTDFNRHFVPGTHYKVDGFLDVSDCPPKILGGVPRQATLQEFLGTTGLEPTDCRGRTLSISHK